MHYLGKCRSCERKGSCSATKWYSELVWTGFKTDFNVKECSQFLKVKLNKKITKKPELNKALSKALLKKMKI